MGFLKRCIASSTPPRAAQKALKKAKFKDYYKLLEVRAGARARHLDAGRGAGSQP